MMSITNNPIITFLLAYDNNVLVGMNGHTVCFVTSYNVKSQQKGKKTVLQQVIDNLFKIMHQQVCALLFNERPQANFFTITHSLHYSVLQGIACISHQTTKATKFNKSEQYLSHHHNYPFGNIECVFMGEIVQFQALIADGFCMNKKEIKRPPVQKKVCLEEVPVAIDITTTVHKVQGKSCRTVVTICITDEIVFCYYHV